MEKTQSIQEQYTAGAQAIGFDYQFYYLCYWLLNSDTDRKSILK